MKLFCVTVTLAKQHGHGHGHVLLATCEPSTRPWVATCKLQVAMHLLCTYKRKAISRAIRDKRKWYGSQIKQLLVFLFFARCLLLCITSVASLLLNLHAKGLRDVRSKCILLATSWPWPVLLRMQHGHGHVTSIRANSFIGWHTTTSNNKKQRNCEIVKKQDKGWWWNLYVKALRATWPCEYHCC